MEQQQADSSWQQEILPCLHLSQACYQADPLAWLNGGCRGQHNITHLKRGYTFVFNPKASEQREEQVFLLAFRPPQPTAEEGSFQQRPTWFLAFRGTADLKDLMTDLYAPPTAMTSQGSFHAGFYSRTENFPLSQCVRWLQEGCNVVFTGHSLGGAVASVACVRVLTSALDPSLQSHVWCITFGQPLIGDEALAESMSKKDCLGRRFHQLTNRRDPVPKLLNVVSNLCAKFRQLGTESWVKKILELFFTIGTTLLEYVQGQLATVIELIKNAFKALQKLDYQSIIDSLVTQFSYFGHYHLLDGNYMHLSAFEKSDAPSLVEHLSLQVESQALQNETRVRQHLLDNYLQNVLNHFGALKEKPVVVQPLECVPLPKIARLTVMPNHKAVRLRLEGEWVNFIAAAGIDGLFPITSRHPEFAQPFSADISSVVFEFPMKKKLHTGRTAQICFFDFLSGAEKHMEVPITLQSPTVPPLLAELGLWSIEDMLVPAYWVILLSPNNHRSALQDVVDSMIRLVPLCILLFGHDECHKDRREYCTGLWKSLVQSSDEVVASAVLDYLLCRAATGVSLESCLALIKDKAPKILPQECYEQNGWQLNHSKTSASFLLHRCTTPQSAKGTEKGEKEYDRSDSKNQSEDWWKSLKHAEGWRILDLVSYFYGLPTVIETRPGSVRWLIGGIGTVLHAPANTAFRYLSPDTQWGETAARVYRGLWDCPDYDHLVANVSKIFAVKNKERKFSPTLTEEIALARRFSSVKLSADLGSVGNRDVAREEPELCLALRQILLVHELRRALAGLFVVLVGEKGTGKTTSLRTLFHLDLQLQGDENSSTVTPRVYEAPDLNLRVLDCPATLKTDSFVIKELVPMATKLPGALCLVFLDCMNPSQEILQSIRLASRPRSVIVCLNKMDEWLSSLGYKTPKAPLSTKEMREVATDVQQKWEKVHESLKRLLYLETGDMIVPTILEPKKLGLPETIEFATNAFKFPDADASLLCLPDQLRTVVHRSFRAMNLDDTLLASFKAWQARIAA